MSTVLITETITVTDTLFSFSETLLTDILTTTTTIAFSTTETSTEVLTETTTQTTTLVSSPPTFTPSTQCSRSTVIALSVFTAIGSLAILAGILGLATYCLRRRRRDTHRGASLPAADRAALRRATSVPTYDPNDLPQDAASSDLRRSFSMLDTDLKNWASEYFHTTPSGMEKVHDQTLIDLLSGGRPHDEHVLAWFSQVKGHKSSVVFVRSYVARVLLDRIDKEDDPRTTLLPSRLLRCYQDIVRQAVSSRRSAGPPPTDVHYWRSKTASLTYNPRQGQHVELSDDCINRISNIKRELLVALAPLRNDKSQDRCAKGLDTIAREVARFGLIAFAQANEVTMHWMPPSADQTVIFPELKQHRIDTGDVLTIREFKSL